MPIQKQVSDFKEQLSNYKARAYDRGHSYYKRQTFSPTFLSIFINPFYLVRKGLHNAISQQASTLNGIMLDFGCSSKVYESLFTHIGYCVGVDIDKTKSIHEHEEKDIIYDGDEIPFEDNYFDSIFSSEFLEHVPDIEHTISDLHRVLRPEGTALFTLPFVWDEHEIPNDYTRFTSYGVRQLFEKQGFKVLHYEKTSNFIATIFQLICLYLRNHLFTKNKYWNIVMNILFISPFTILGLLYSFILPNDKRLFLNHILLVKKVQIQSNEANNSVYNE